MAGSVENIPLRESIGQEYRNHYTDPKASPISLRKESNMAVTNGCTTHKGKGNGDINRGDSLDFNRSDSDSADESEVARSLAQDFVGYKTDSDTISTRAPSVYAETLRRVGDEIEEKYEISLNGIVNQLKYDPVRDGKRAFYASMDAMFDEGPCSWGRVVMVYVFAARLAKHCQKTGRDHIYVENLVRYSGDYVSGRLADWIKEQGGWNDFCSKFKAKNWKDTAVFNSLLGTGLVLGGMALLRLITQ